MRVPIGWLREYVDLPASAEAIADRLAMLGFPVEEIERRPAISGVVVGKIVALEKHPNADRLQVAQVDVDGDRTLTIATAATNVAVGQVIPVATIGARLPKLTIEPRKMRGIASEGMMVSADELALPAEWFEDGIMQLDPDHALGANVVELFGLDAEILDVEITGNRVDAMSMIGLARELAASYGVPLRLPSFVNPGTAEEPAGEAPRATLETPACKRFVAQRFDDVRVGPAPAWIRLRLALAGQRPINNLVDVSNYVMLETGQPLHFYDAAHVANQHLIVRDARPGEKLVTLDGTERELAPAMLVIADESTVLGVAGVMGGAGSEIGESTTQIVLESANFIGARVRRASMQLGLRTEASSRHEKTLAPALADIGAARAAQLLVMLGATAYVPHIFGEDVPATSPIELRVRDVERILGLTLTLGRIETHLAALGCVVETHGDALRVTAPAWRSDLVIAADLVEEVARMEGYDNIEAVVPSVPAHEIGSLQYDFENRIAHALAALGYDEVITHSLHGTQLFERMKRAGVAPSHKSVEVRNPLSEDQRYLRFAIAPGLVEYLARYDVPVRVFELGHVFWLDEGHVAEPALLTFAFTAEPLDEPAWRDSNFLRLKGDCEALVRTITGRQVEATPDQRTGLHPGKTAVLMSEGREIAIVGRLLPQLAKVHGARLPIYVCNIYLDAFPDYQPPRYAPPSKLPATYRDLALVVGLGVTAGEIERTIGKTLGSLATSVRVFDEYRGPQVGDGHKSLAVRVTLQRFDATLTDEEADEAIARALQALRDELGAVIRE
jgi:phenylalanyl-tRNA synthetase beta chain